MRTQNIFKIALILNLKEIGRKYYFRELFFFLFLYKIYMNILMEYSHYDNVISDICKIPWEWL